MLHDVSVNGELGEDRERAAQPDDVDVREENVPLRTQHLHDESALER